MNDVVFFYDTCVRLFQLCVMFLFHAMLLVDEGDGRMTGVGYSMMYCFDVLWQVVMIKTLLSVD